MNKLIQTETTTNLVVIAMGLAKLQTEGAYMALLLVNLEINKRIFIMEDRIYGS